MNLLAELGRHPLRIQRRRTEGWRKPEGAVAITRPGVFGNPFFTAGSFERWILHGEIVVNDLRPQGMIPWCEEKKDRLRRKREVILERLPQLRGKQLMCFCGVGQACHGDVLARMANCVTHQLVASRELMLDTPYNLMMYLRQRFRDECETQKQQVIGTISWKVIEIKNSNRCLIDVTGDTLPIDFKQGADQCE
jgi:hypothetical protein